MRAGAHLSMQGKLSQQDAVNDVSSEVKLLTLTDCMLAVFGLHALQDEGLSLKAPGSMCKPIITFLWGLWMEGDKCETV